MCATECLGVAACLAFHWNEKQGVCALKRARGTAANTGARVKWKQQYMWYNKRAPTPACSAPTAHATTAATSTSSTTRTSTTATTIPATQATAASTALTTAGLAATTPAACPSLFFFAQGGEGFVRGAVIKSDPTLATTAALCATECLGAAVCLAFHWSQALKVCALKKERATLSNTAVGSAWQRKYTWYNKRVPAPACVPEVLEASAPPASACEASCADTGLPICVAKMAAGADDNGSLERDMEREPYPSFCHMHCDVGGAAPAPLALPCSRFCRGKTDPAVCATPALACSSSLIRQVCPVLCSSCA